MLLSQIAVNHHVTTNSNITIPVEINNSSKHSIDVIYLAMGHRPENEQSVLTTIEPSRIAHISWELFSPPTSQARFSVGLALQGLSSNSLKTWDFSLTPLGKGVELTKLVVNIRDLKQVRCQVICSMSNGVQRHFNFQGNETPELSPLLF